MSLISPRFQEAWDDETKVLDMNKYDRCLVDFQKAHTKQVIKKLAFAIVFFCAGLWAAAEKETVLSVLFLGLAFNWNNVSSHHALLIEIANSQRLLAMLINNQTRATETVQKEITGIQRTNA